MSDQADQQVIDEVLEAEYARLRAIDEHDFDAHDLLIADDLSYVHSDTGEYQDKPALIERLHNSPRSYKRRDLRVRLYDDIAVMTGEIDITIDAIPGASDEQHVFSRATQVWIHRDNRWQMIVFQATMIKERN